MTEPYHRLMAKEWLEHYREPALSWSDEVGEGGCARSTLPAELAGPPHLEANVASELSRAAEFTSRYTVVSG